MSCHVQPYITDSVYFFNHSHTGSTSSVATQDTLAALIAEGHLARHLRKMRRVYGERREMLESALERFCGDRLRMTGIRAGLHLAAHLDRALSATALTRKAGEPGIILEDLQRFAMQPRKVNGLVFGYGAIDARRIVESMHRLASLMK